MLGDPAAAAAVPPEAADKPVSTTREACIEGREATREGRGEARCEARGQGRREARGEGGEARRRGAEAVEAPRGGGEA